MSSAQFCPLSKLDKLLLATDRSVFSEGAVREAINFAKKCSSRLYVMSVLETNPEYETIGASAYQKEEEEAIKYLESVYIYSSFSAVQYDICFPFRKGQRDPCPR